MNATERAALLQGFDLYDQLSESVDERTLAILDHRRRTAVVRRRGWLVRRMLLVADVLGLLLAMGVAEWVVSMSRRTGQLDVTSEILVFGATIPFWIVAAKLYGLYDHDEERTDHSTTDDFAGVFHMVTVCTWLFAAFAHVTGVTHPNLTKLTIFWIAAVGLVSTGRGVARAVVRRRAAYLQNAVIVGAGEVGQLVAKKLLNHPEYGINVVGFIDSRPTERRDDLEHLALLGGPEKLAAVVRLLDVERVIIAFSNEANEDTLELIRSLKNLDVQVDIVPRFFEILSPAVGLHTVEGLPLVGLPPLRLSRSSKLLKRAMDLSLSLAGLAVLWPLFVLIALAIRLDSAGPVFFRQVRMGARGETFTIFKFRTMVADAEDRKSSLVHLNKHLAPGGDARMFKIQGDPRVTRVGGWLRRYSLDELPQLFNVLYGTMSLVGPRPLILDEDRHVGAWGRERLNLKPGVTGPWQVLGASAIPFSEMVRLDYLYVTSWSLGRDLALLCRTLPIPFHSRLDETI